MFGIEHGARTVKDRDQGKTYPSFTVLPNQSSRLGLTCVAPGLRFTLGPMKTRSQKLHARKAQAKSANRSNAKTSSSKTPSEDESSESSKSKTSKTSKGKAKDETGGGK